MWIKIAARNLLKNKRRSMFALLAIAFGFAAVNMFGGFTAWIFQNLEESYVYGRGNGHISVFKTGFLERGQGDPAGYLISPGEYAEIASIAQAMPGLSVVTPQLLIIGLISNGETSSIFVAPGRNASDFYAIRGKASGIIRNLKNYEGEPLEDERPRGVGLGMGLSKRLNLSLGARGLITAPTIHGRTKKLEFEVVQLVEGASELLNEQLMLMPISFAQSLYDTDSVGQVNILLENGDDTNEMIGLLEQRFEASGLSLEVRSWEQLSPFYLKVRNMFYVIFTFVFVIVFMIASLSVVNTVGMAAMERITEIGTLRALGATRQLVNRLFIMESGLLGALGVGAGLILTLLGWWLLRMLEITWIPPQFTVRVPLEVYLVPSYLVATAVVFITLAVLSAIPPVQRATKRGIVGALGHA